MVITAEFGLWGFLFVILIVLAAPFLAAAVVWQGGTILQQRHQLRTFRASGDPPAELVAQSDERLLGYALFHQLSNNLQVLTGAVANLNDALNGADSWTDDTQRNLQRINERVQHLNSLSQKLQLLINLEQGRQQVDHAAVDLTELVTALLEARRPAAERQNVTLAFSGGTLPCRVWGDRVLLWALVDNLLENSLRYMGDGGGRIDVTLETRPANAACPSENHARVRLSVADNGIGIEPDSLPHLFELGYRTPDAPRHSRSGMGVGLALVQAIAQQHEIAIALQSTPGMGTMVMLDFVNLTGREGHASTEEPGRDKTDDT